jgi:D-lactate dehydrogenase
MISRTIGALWVSSDGGRLPVVCDNSSCSEGLVLALEKAIEKHPEFHSMRMVDAVDFAAERILPHLDVRSKLGSVVLHPTCSSTRAGSNPNLEKLAGAIAAGYTIPDDWGCCAFAGDRGMLHPELTASATAGESAEARAGEFDAYASCNRTCEIGMTRATGHEYQHILELLDHATREK